MDDLALALASAALSGVDPQIATTTERTQAYWDLTAAKRKFTTGGQPSTPGEANILAMTTQPAAYYQFRPAELYVILSQPPLSAGGATLTSLNPVSTTTATPPFELQVNGTAFTPQHVVLIAGQAVATTYVSETQLTATYNPALYRAGGVPVAVKGPAGGVTNTLTVTQR